MWGEPGASVTLLCGVLCSSPHPYQRETASADEETRRSKERSGSATWGEPRGPRHLLLIGCRGQGVRPHIPARGPESRAEPRVPCAPGPCTGTAPRSPPHSLPRAGAGPPTHAHSAGGRRRDHRERERPGGEGGRGGPALQQLSPACDSPVPAVTRAVTWRSG